MTETDYRHYISATYGPKNSQKRSQTKNLNSDYLFSFPMIRRRRKNEIFSLETFFAVLGAISGTYVVAIISFGHFLTIIVRIGWVRIKNFFWSCCILDMPFVCPEGDDTKNFSFLGQNLTPPPGPPKVYVVNVVLAIWAIVPFFTKLAATVTFIGLEGWIALRLISFP